MEMSAPPPFKRRRLHSSVNKPFKSPIRTPLKPTFASANASPLSTAPLTPAATSAKLSQTTFAVSTPTSLHARPLPPTTSHSSPSLKPSTSPPDPTLTAALHHAALEARRLESTILSTRQDIDVLTQALSLRRSDRAAELEALTEKWRGAARLAAEELFATARERVHRMGGASAWRDREREARRGWEEDARTARGEGEKEGWDDEGEADERVEEDIARSRRREEREWGDEEGFTMGMMLKSLGIDFGVIGYSKEKEMWVG